MSGKKSELPHTLIEAVKDGRAVVVLGAGASMECLNSAGQRPPSGEQLRDLLAKKFLGREKETRDLAMVAEMAISSGVGEPLVFEEVSKLLSGFSPSKAHISLADFRWRGLATTNYDQIIESAYSANSVAKQTCIPFVKDAEPYDDRLKTAMNPVPLLKLHGCLDHRLDRDIPLVLSHEHYHRLKANRTTLLERLKHWAQHSVIIFVGYRLADAHIRSLIYDIDPGRRPQWYIVAPGADDYDRKFWLTKNVEIIPEKFGSFMSLLEGQIPALFRSLPPRTPQESDPVRKFFRTNSAGSDRLVQSLATDLELIHSGISFDEVPPSLFYSGYDNGWCGIVRKYDFQRKSGEKILYDALDGASSTGQNFLLLHGPGGSGKTVSLRRAAYDAASALDEPVLWLKEAGALHPEVFEELYDLTGLRWVLFVDHVALHAEGVRHLLDRMKSKSIPITIVASERESDWSTYCDKLEKSHPPEIYWLRGLNEREAGDLVDLLDRHGCLGMLQAKPRQERIAAFLDQDRSDRQLLVALHELTRGKPFEDIVQEEYQRVQPDIARRLYLDVATMHQFRVTARAGAISRISGIRFEDFEARFFAPLRGMVRVIRDRYTGDHGYETRHSRVASIVFGTSCPTDSEKSHQFSRIITGLDAGYSSDKIILEGICKGRTLSSMFTDVDHGREIFLAAFDAAPRSAFLFQQGAIYEYTHPSGCLDRAQELAEMARSIDDNNHIYIHTLAEVARRKANNADSPIKADQLRAQARTYLNEIWIKNDARKDLTFCNLLIDEALDHLKSMSEESKDFEVIEFDSKVDAAVERLKRARQDHPSEAEFSAAEARLWQKLGESELAESSLEKAIKARPRNSGVFIRLARIKSKKLGLDQGISTLKEGLEKFPNDKALHFELAKAHLSSDEVDASIAQYCLRSSFSAEDHNFDARFLLAEFLFWQGEVDEAKSLFDTIDKRAPEGFRSSAPSANDVVTDKLGQFAGTVQRRKERFFFIRFGGYPDAVFAHMSSLRESEYEDLREGQSVKFRLRFNRKGPVAYDVRLASSI